MKDVSYIPYPKARYKHISSLPPALSTALFDFISSNSNFYITGGGACEIYFTEEFQRGTSDIDLAIERRLTHKEFLTVFTKLADVASQLNLGHEFRQTGFNYILTINGIETEDTPGEKISIGINVPNMTAAHYYKTYKKIHRESANTREAEFEHSSGKKIPFRLMAPEDIIAHKHKRLIQFYKNNGVVYPLPGSYDEWLNDIWLMREQLHKAEVEKIKFESEENKQKFLRLKTFLRSACDIYDSTVLYNHARIDNDYLHKAWDDNIERNPKNLTLAIAATESWLDEAMFANNIFAGLYPEFKHILDEARIIERQTDSTLDFPELPTLSNRTRRPKK